MTILGGREDVGVGAQVAPILNWRKLEARMSDQKQWIRQDPCVYCGSPRAFTTDHIEPVARGGRNGWFNYAPACEKCNRRKGTRSVVEFLAKRGAA